jgi:hypothetical protein
MLCCTGSGIEPLSTGVAAICAGDGGMECVAQPDTSALQARGIKGETYLFIVDPPPKAC